MWARGVTAAALLALLAAGCSNSATSDTSDVGDAAAPVPARLDAGCPPDDVPLRLATGDLPTGAVAVRLCPGAPVVGHDGTWHGPFVQPVPDELTTGVEALVDLVNGLPTYEPGACPLDGGPDITYWFRYPDGDARAVAYGEYGCHTLTAGEDLEREDGEQLARAFAEALVAQRDAVAPAGMRDRASVPRCPRPTVETRVSVLPQAPLRLVAATWCEGLGPRRSRSATVPTALVGRLNAGLLGRRVTGRERCPSVTYLQSLEGVNAWGDRVSYWVVSDCRVYVRVGYGRDTNMATFDAAPDLIRALRALPTTRVIRWDDQ